MLLAPHSDDAQSRLARRPVEVMVEKVTGGKALSAEVVQQVVAKTDGVPLFVEELTKMVVESALDRSGATQRRPRAAAGHSLRRCMTR